MNIGLYIGTFSTSAICVFEMKNFNPFTLAFWATIIGVCVLSFIFGSVGSALTRTIKKELKQWHGTSRTFSKV